MKSAIAALALTVGTAGVAKANTIVDIAAADDRFSTLVAAVTAAVGTALEGANVCVTKGEGVMLDDGSGMMANVIIADIEASNGVIHVIDKVILPGNDVACD